MMARQTEARLLPGGDGILLSDEIGLMYGEPPTQPAPVFTAAEKGKIKTAALFLRRKQPG